MILVFDKYGILKTEYGGGGGDMPIMVLDKNGNIKNQTTGSPAFITSVSDTTTIDLDVTAEVLTAEVVDNSNIQKVEITKNGGAVVGTRKQLNFIEGTNITLTIADDNVNDQVDITIDASGGGGVSSVTDDGNGVVSVDNTDPANPIIGFNGVYVSGGVEGDGTSGNPLNIDTFEEDVDLLKSTGVLTGGALSIGTGGAGVATTFTIAAGTGRVVDNTVSPTTSIDFSWTQFTDVAITNLATNTISYVAIDYNGGTPQVVQSITDWTPSEFRQYIEIGVVVHANLTVVNAVNQMQSVAYNPINQFQDLTYSLGGFNISGNVFSANGANLKINKSAGYVFRQGSNYTTLTDNPHVKALASLTQASLRMQNQTGAGSASTTDVDVDNYDVGGVTTAVPVNKYTILRIYSFVSNLVAIQRGQAYYNSLAEAKANIQLEPYVSNQVLEENGILRGFLCVQQGTTALNNTSKAAFLPAGKFGGEVGVGGLSVSTMQNTYDNSTDPEIVTDSTRGAVTIKRGSAADTDDVIEIQNGSSVQKFAVTGNGKIFTASETASRIASINSGQEIESLDTATYPSLTELSYVKGVTSSVQTQLDTKMNRAQVMAMVSMRF